MQELTYEKVLELFAESSRRMEEEDKRLSRQLDKLGRQIGDLTDTLGEFAENQVRPKAIEMFRERGIILDEFYYRPKKEDDKGRKLYELDLLLVNTIYAVAIEVKNTLRQDDVEDHLKRLEKVKQNPLTAVIGKSLLGAVAGMAMTTEVEEFAVKRGLFVIKPKGDGVEIINKPSFQPKEWEIENK